MTHTHDVLRALVARVRCKPGWSFRLTEEDGALRLVITVPGYDSSRPGLRLRPMTVRHFFPVPTATYNERTWRRWIFERCRGVGAQDRAGQTRLHVERNRVDVGALVFIDALRDLVDREIWNIPCQLEVDPSFHIEDETAASQLYLIAREAVINANKHAQARGIVVEIRCWQNGSILSVTDDGVGFQSEPKNAPGLGLPIMKHRAHSIGGRLEIESPKKGGTRVACYMPRQHTPIRQKRNARPARFPAKITKASATRS